MELRQRKNHRLKNFDYGSYGYYYVTICTSNRNNVLCDIVGSDALVAPPPIAPPPIAPPPIAPPPIAPSDIGKKVIECWNNISLLNKNVEVDQFVLMPNHIHGIIIIKNTEPAPQNEKKYAFEIAERRGRRSLQGLIKDFKSVTTRHYKKLFHADLSLWQESFYDQVIKNQEHYKNVWQYIKTNPQNWRKDEFYKK